MDLKQAGFHLNTWENTADVFWKAAVTNGIKRAERTRDDNLTIKRAK